MISEVYKKLLPNLDLGALDNLSGKRKVEAMSQISNQLLESCSPEVLATFLAGEIIFRGETELFNEQVESLSNEKNKALHLHQDAVEKMMMGTKEIYGMHQQITEILKETITELEVPAEKHKEHVKKVGDIARKAAKANAEKMRLELNKDQVYIWFGDEYDTHQFKKRGSQTTFVNLAIDRLTKDKHTAPAQKTIEKWIAQWKKDIQ